MGRGSKYFKEVERLLRIGYEPKHVMNMTGIPKSTVYRIVNKLQVESRYDFKRTMSHDFLWKYQMNMENLSQTIQECNTEIDVVKQKYGGIETMILGSIEELTLPRQANAKSALLQNLIQCQSSRTNELIKLAQQRDKASEAKAKLFNQGAVVNAVHDWVNNKPPPMGTSPEIPELDKVSGEGVSFEVNKPLELNKLSEEEEEELRVQKEMEEDDE